MPYLQIGDPPAKDVNHPYVGKIINDNEDSQFTSTNPANSAIVFSIDDYAAPPGAVKMVNPFNKNPEEDIVMVIPTVQGVDGEITAGIIFMVVSFIFMCIFGIFAYLSVKRYRSLLDDKQICENDIENLNSTESVVTKSEKLKPVSYTSVMMNSKKQDQFKFNKNNLKEKENTITPRKVADLPEKPQKGHNKSNDFKSAKLINKTENMKEYFKKENLDSNDNGKEDLDTSIGLTTIAPVNLIKGNLEVKKQENLKKRNSKLKLKVYKPEATESVYNDSNKNIEYQSESIYLNPQGKSIKHNKLVRKLSRKLKPKSSRITYTIKELVELEPIAVYQMFEYSYDDGDLLVTDLIFPSIPVVKNNITMVELENDLTDIRNALMSTQVDSSTKILEIFRFITFSFEIKSYNNPKIFTLPYGILVDTIIQFDLVSQIPDHLSLIIQSAFVETVIMYCINCWKFNKSKSGKVMKSFKKWGIEPYVPTKLKLFKFIVTLLLHGYRSNLLKEVLIYFSMPSSPHFLQNVISEALNNETTVDIQELLQYLKRQLQEEHQNCCSNTEKWKHWELTTAGIKSSRKLDEEEKEKEGDDEDNDEEDVTSILSLSKVPKSKYESLMNAMPYKKEKYLKMPHKSKGGSLDDIYRRNNTFFDENNFEDKQPIKLTFNSEELPGSYLPSPIRSPVHMSSVR